MGQSAVPLAASSDPPPLRVTTDTPEYCASLAGRIDHDQRIRPPAAPMLSYADEIVTLTAEGRRMCENGLVVGGIARLRRAWMLLHPEP